MLKMFLLLVLINKQCGIFKMSLNFGGEWGDDSRWNMGLCALCILSYSVTCISAYFHDPGSKSCNQTAGRLQVLAPHPSPRFCKVYPYLAFFIAMVQTYLTWRFDIPVMRSLLHKCNISFIFHGQFILHNYQKSYSIYQVIFTFLNYDRWRSNCRKYGVWSSMPYGESLMVNGLAIPLLSLESQPCSLTMAQPYH